MSYGWDLTIGEFWAKLWGGDAASESYEGLVYCIILLYYENGDVCKKLEPKRLRFDRDIRVLSLEKIATKFLKKFDSGQKKCRKSASFQDFVDFFCPMRSVITPLVYIWVYIDTRGCIKSPEKPKDSCGHLVPPRVLPGSRTPGLIGLIQEISQIFI